MKMFTCIIDDGNDVYKETVPAKNKKEMLERWGGNGEFVKIEDTTDQFLTADGAVELLSDTLAKAGYGVPEQRLLVALLEQHQQSARK